jgi:hypothetical protein
MEELRAPEARGRIHSRVGGVTCRLDAAPGERGEGAARAPGCRGEPVRVLQDSLHWPAEQRGDAEEHRTKERGTMTCGSQLDGDNKSMTWHHVQKQTQRG